METNGDNPAPAKHFRVRACNMLRLLAANCNSRTATYVTGPDAVRFLIFYLFIRSFNRAFLVWLWLERRFDFTR
jgi:hypothetical protein